MIKWQILHSGENPATLIMQKDQELLDALTPTSHPILHLYKWKGDCATYGCFTKPEDFLNMENVKALHLSLAKRPTGGGIVFHICDFAFSVVIPANHPKFSINTLDNYALINNAVIHTIQKIKNDTTPILLPQESPPLDSYCQKFCMAKPTKYDVILQGKKIGGASQRRTKHGFLHQGTIAVALLPKEYLEKIILPETKVIEAMQNNSASLLGNNWTLHDLQAMREIVSINLQECMQEI
ncbi:MAG: lipoate--protein ligase family protein [Chlamydiales bacterium]|nr:lipoate--protein ligase family protein [Chlamydiales bacterium]